MPSWTVHAPPSGSGERVRTKTVETGCASARQPPMVAGMHATDEPAHQRIWNEEDVRALGVRTDLATACGIVYGVGRSRAWELFHADQLDFPAFRKGRSVWVPVKPLLRLLEGDGKKTDEATEAA